MGNSEKNMIVLSNTGKDCVLLLDGRSWDTIRNVNTSASSGPHGITVCENRQFLYFSNLYSNCISLFNISEGCVEDSAATGATPCHIAETGSMLYVSNFDSDSVSVIDSGEMAGIVNIPSGRMPHDVAVWGGAVIVAESGAESIGIIDGKNCEYADRVVLKCAPVHICRIPGKNIFAAACTEYGIEVKGYICVIDVKNPGLEERIRVGNCLTDIEADDDGVHVYVTDGGKGSIYKVNISSGLVVGNVFLSGFPSSVTSDYENSRLFVVDQMNDLIYVLRKDTMAVERIICKGRDVSHVLCL